jgi:hypothetical protein
MEELLFSCSESLCTRLQIPLDLPHIQAAFLLAERFFKLLFLFLFHPLS